MCINHIFIICKTYEYYNPYHKIFHGKPSSPRKRAVRTHRNIRHHIVLRGKPDADIAEALSGNEAVLHLRVGGRIKPISLQFLPCTIHTHSRIDAEDRHILKPFPFVADMSRIQRFKGKQLFSILRAHRPLLESRIRLFHHNPVFFRKQRLRRIQKMPYPSAPCPLPPLASSDKQV